jgi:ABC-type antimicrobial peptide transport system permease subunit
MSENQKNHPPRLAEQFLNWYCRPELLEDLQGDLHEFFERNVQTKGIKKARLIYIIDVLKFFRLYTIRKPTLHNFLSRQFMIRSYIKTSGRSILRHKLFAGINIIGLAISMCVGLLIISFLSDLYSYDDFNTKKERIYRVVTHDAHDNDPFEMNLATTSYVAGKDIQRTIPGIESITFLRRGFNGDATIGDKTVPVSGLWATESMFDVFSFPFLKGNPKTALQKPNSIILTEISAKKLFDHTDVIGKLIKIDTSNYMVTGVLKDIPKLSHIRFEVLASYSTLEGNKPDADGDMTKWENIYSNYTYIVLPPNANKTAIQASLNKISVTENSKLQNRKISLSLEPMSKIIVGDHYANEIGPAIGKIVIYILSGLALIVIISACFNYTNLSIARSLTRSREVGIRKVIGAKKANVIWQFITESILISLFSLVVAFFLFLIMRQQFLSLHRFVQSLASLELSPRLIVYFILFAIVTGFIAGILPALFYSRITAIQVLNNVSNLKVFRHVNLRKSLIVLQYTFSFIFIATTIVGYNQYRSFITYDLGFSTKNILNINMQGNKTSLLSKEIAAIPGVKEISKSIIISSLGSIYGSTVKYDDPQDSSHVQLNFIDEHYLNVHEYKMLAGTNFTVRTVDSMETQAIVNEQLIRRFKIGNGDPQKAIGKIVNIDRKKLAIVGVLQDFHYGTLENKIEPVMFRYSGGESAGYLNVKIESPNLSAILASVNEAWRKTDKVHPLDAKFYDDQIEEAYSQFSVIIKVVGFFSFLAIVIASMGLFGMVVYTTEKRLKEISIRKVMGANEGSLIYLMSKSFFFLLLLSALIALPATWIFFDKVVLSNFAYHQPLQLSDQFLSFFIVMIIAGVMIGFQTLKVARSNPAEVLKRE